MYEVKVENPCRCFFRSGLPEVQSFRTKEEAEAEAKDILAHMQQNFCKKHSFYLVEVGTRYMVSIRDN